MARDQTGEALEGSACTSLVPVAPTRGGVVRTFVWFQIKLVIDGLKDVLLSPLSLVVLLLGMISPKRAGGAWTRLYGMGRAFDHWINLFPDDHPARQHANSAGSNGSADMLFAETEGLLKALRRGGPSDPEVRAKLATMTRAIERVSTGLTTRPAGPDAEPGSDTKVQSD